MFKIGIKGINKVLCWNNGVGRRAQQSRIIFILRHERLEGEPRPLPSTGKKPGHASGSVLHTLGLALISCQIHLADTNKFISPPINESEGSKSGEVTLAYTVQDRIAQFPSIPTHRYAGRSKHAQFYFFLGSVVRKAE